MQCACNLHMQMRQNAFVASLQHMHHVLIMMASAVMQNVEGAPMLCMQTSQVLNSISVTLMQAHGFGLQQANCQGLLLESSPGYAR